MSPQTSFGRWTLRDWRLSSITLAGIAVILFILSYFFNGWAPPWLKGAIGLHVSGAGQVRGSGKDDDAKQYLGSIIMSPRRGDKCWERGLDNRTGAIWDKGPVDCDVVPPLKMLQNDSQGLAARRLKAIGKAFTPNKGD